MSDAITFGDIRPGDLIELHWGSRPGTPERRLLAVAVRRLPGDEVHIVWYEPDLGRISPEPVPRRRAEVIVDWALVARGEER